MRKKISHIKTRIQSQIHFVLTFCCALICALTCPLATAAKANKCTDALSTKIRFANVLDDLKMAYRVQTPKNWNGETQILISGLSKSSLYWNPHTEAVLSSGRRLIRFDLFNTAETLRKNGPVTGIDIHRDALAIAQTLKKILKTDGPLYIVGHSRGAAVALELADILDAQQIVRVDLCNPFVRWLPDVYREINKVKIQTGMQSWNILNPWAWNPFTAPYVQASQYALSEYWAEMGMDFAEKSFDMRSEMSRLIRNRLDYEETGLSLDLEIKGLMRMMDAIKGSSILPTAKRIQNKDIHIRLATASDDNVLVPPQAVQELVDALNLKSSDQFVVTGGHEFPKSNRTYFLNWILK